MDYTLEFFEHLSPENLKTLYDICSISQSGNERTTRLVLYQECARLNLLESEFQKLMKSELFLTLYILEEELLVDIAVEKLNLTLEQLKNITQYEVCCMIVRAVEVDAPSVENDNQNTFLKKEVSYIKMQVINVLVADSTEHCLDILRLILNMREQSIRTPAPIKWKGSRIWFETIQLIPLEEYLKTHTDFRTHLTGKILDLCNDLYELSLVPVSANVQDFAIDNDGNLWIVDGWKNYMPSKLCSVDDIFELLADALNLKIEPSMNEPHPYNELCPINEPFINESSDEIFSITTSENSLSDDSCEIYDC